MSGHVLATSQTDLAWAMQKLRIWIFSILQFKVKFFFHGLEILGDSFDGKHNCHI